MGFCVVSFFCADMLCVDTLAIYPAGQAMLEFQCGLLPGWKSGLDKFIVHLDFRACCTRNVLPQQTIDIFIMKTPEVTNRATVSDCLRYTKGHVMFNNYAELPIHFLVGAMVLAKQFFQLTDIIGQRLYANTISHA